MPRESLLDKLLEDPSLKVIHRLTERRVPDASPRERRVLAYLVTAGMTAEHMLARAKVADNVCTVLCGMYIDLGYVMLLAHDVTAERAHYLCIKSLDILSDLDQIIAAGYAEVAANATH